MFMFIWHCQYFRCGVCGYIIITVHHFMHHNCIEKINKNAQKASSNLLHSTKLIFASSKRCVFCTFLLNFDAKWQWCEIHHYSWKNVLESLSYIHIYLNNWFMTPFDCLWQWVDCQKFNCTRFSPVFTLPHFACLKF